MCGSLSVSTKMLNENVGDPMTVKTMDVREAHSHWQDLLSLVGQGAEVVLTEQNIPVARLVPISSPATPRVAGLHPETICTSPDFDEPIMESFWMDDE